MWVRKLGMSRAEWVEKLAFPWGVGETLAAVGADLGCGSESVVSRGAARRGAPKSEL